MTKIAILLGLCPPLAQLFLGKRNAIIARLNLFAQVYMGAIEIQLPEEKIIFRFPLTIMDVGQQKFSGTVVFYARTGSGWRCDFGAGKDCPWRTTTGMFFRRYENKFDKRTIGQEIADVFVTYSNDLTQGNHLEFRDINLDKVRVGPAFLALEDHFETLKKEIES